MLRTSMIAAVSAAVLMFSPTAFAQQTGGTAVPTGTVGFTDTVNGSTVSLGSAALGGGGIATISPSFGAGSHAIAAMYSGDQNNAASSSSPFALTVQ